jgi:hypothetical protein
LDLTFALRIPGDRVANVKSTPLVSSLIGDFGSKGGEPAPIPAL